jgi:hypothetical protein
MSAIRVSLATALTAALLAGTAQSKVLTTVRSTPRSSMVGDVVTLTVSIGDAQGCNHMKLDAVAPGFSINNALRRLDRGQGVHPSPRRIFRVKSLRRTSRGTWSGHVRFPVAGMWRFVVPNFCGVQGYVIPAGVTSVGVDVARRE